MPLQPPPIDKLFTSADEAFQSLQAHARNEGYAIVRTRPSSYENNKPRRYDISCVRGNGEYKSKASGLRKATTKRTGCPFKMKIVQRKDTNDLWVPGILCGDHNHESNLAVSFPEHRRGALTKGQKIAITTLLNHTNLSARAIIETVTLQYPDLLLTEKDVSNLRREIIKAAPQGLTEIPFPRQNTIQITNNRNQSGRQGQQQPIQRLGNIGSLQPYEQCLQF